MFNYTTDILVENGAITLSFLDQYEEEVCPCIRDDFFGDIQEDDEDIT